MIKTLKKYLHRYSISRTRTQLLAMGDRQLEDLGISKDLLLHGNDFWPWRENSMDQLDSQPKRMSSAEINKAIKDLSQYTDQQLRDIGISRGSIREAVLHGTDRDPKHAA